MPKTSGNVWNVFKYEFLSLVKRRSFILSLVLVPLIPMLIIGALKLLQGKDVPSIQEVFVKELANPLPFGIVDESGLITQYPEWSKMRFIAIEGEAQAREKTAAGELQGFYRISKDYLTSGEITLIKPEVNMVSELAETKSLGELIKFNLIDGDEALYTRMTNPMAVETRYLDVEKADTRDQSSGATFGVPFAIALFFYMLIIISSNQMLSAISKEKENRTIEILLSSTSPMDLFLGKVFARGAATLLQTTVWLGTILLVSKLNNSGFTLPFQLDLSPHLLVFGLPFFVVGFLLFGSLLAGMGAMAPNTREGSQYMMIVNMPLVFAYISINQIIASPTSTMTTFLTLFPMTSPIVIPTRIAIGILPGWQIAASLAILLITTLLVMRGVSHLFSSQTLLSGEKFNIKTFFRTLVFGK